MLAAAGASTRRRVASERARFGSWLEAYLAGSAQWLTEQVTLPGVGGALARVAQPGGDYADPPTPDVVLGCLQGRPITADVDLGAGPFRGRFREGDLFLTPPYTATRYRSDGDCAALVLSVPLAHVRTLLPEHEAAERGDFGVLHEGPLRDPFLSALIDRLWSEVRAGTEQSALFTEGAVATLFGALAGLAERGARRAGPARGGLAPGALRRATERLATSLAGNVTLAELAADAGLSPFHFARAFKQSTGVPPHRYQLRLRIDVAKRLLETTDRPITAIALEVGYESSQALARLFRRECGTSPGEWRRRRRR
jgi:AraC family transcriptional regulator